MRKIEQLYVLGPLAGEYRLDIMPLMIQKKKKQMEYRIAMIGWARLSLFFFTLDVLYLYFTVPMTWDVFMYTMC